VTVQNIGEPWKVVVSAAKPATAEAKANTAPLSNAGQTGYFRSAYDADTWARLAPLYPQLDPADQLGLLFDSRALGETGDAPMSRFLDLALAASPAADPVVQQTLAAQLEALDYYFAGRPTQAAFRAFGRARLAPMFARVGWEPKAGEADNDQLLRATLIRILGEFDDPAVVAEARKRFAAYLGNPDSLTGAMRQTVLGIVARHADEATWEQLHRLAQQATTPPTGRGSTACWAPATARRWPTRRWRWRSPPSPRTPTSRGSSRR
jgi:aminopeptidase N